MTGRRIALAVAGLVVATGSLTGCGTSGVTHGRLETSFQATFANLYVLQQRDRGRTVHALALRSRAACGRGTVPQAVAPSGSGSGAGADWTCLVTWFVDAGDPVQAKFTVEVKPNGCYTADGDGPTEINGEQTLVTPDGRTLTNPLWRFDGCFDQI